MIDPKEIIVDNKRYIISKVPATAMRHIVTQYPVSAIPKIGDYKTNEEMMFKLMSYVAIPMDSGVPLVLVNRELIDNHVSNWESLLKIEAAMMEYNCSFFQNGRVSGFLADIEAKLPAYVTKIWTALSEQLSQTEKPPSTN